MSIFILLIRNIASNKRVSGYPKACMCVSVMQVRCEYAFRWVHCIYSCESVLYMHCVVCVVNDVMSMWCAQSMCVVTYVVPGAWCACVLWYELCGVESRVHVCRGCVRVLMGVCILVCTACVRHMDDCVCFQQA